MNRFNINETYTYTRQGDHNAVHAVTVTRRTETNLWIENSDGETRRCKIHNHDGTEIAYPEGQHSLCPVIKAEAATSNLLRII